MSQVQADSGGRELRSGPRVEVNIEAELLVSGPEVELNDELTGSWFDETPQSSGIFIDDGEAPSASLSAPPAVPSFAADVSETGMRLCATGGLDLQAGDAVRVRLSMPGEKEAPMTISGTVVRAQGDEAALRFTFLPEEARERLGQFVAHFATERGQAEMRPNYLDLALRVPLELY